MPQPKGKSWVGPALLWMAPEWPAFAPWALHGARFQGSLAQEGDRRMIVPKGKVEIENTGLGRALSLKKSYDAVLAGSRRISKKGWTNE